MTIQSDDLPLNEMFAAPLLADLAAARAENAQLRAERDAAVGALERIATYEDKVEKLRSVEGLSEVLGIWYDIATSALRRAAQVGGEGSYDNRGD